MNKLITFATLVIFTFSIVSCESLSKDKEAKKPEKPIISKQSTPEKNSEETESPKLTHNQSKEQCNKYLREYKAWLDKFIAVQKKYKSNSNDPEAIQEYKKLVETGKKLGDPIEDCINDREFQDSLLKISEMANNLLDQTGE